MENESDLMQVNIRMTPEMQTTLKIRAAILGTNVSAIVRQAIEEYLDQQEHFVELQAAKEAEAIVATNDADWLLIVYPNLPAPYKPPSAT
jgi:predicted DNA-binding protein